MRSVKWMLLGIAIMLAGNYIPHEFRSRGYEIFILVLGFIIVVIGFFKKDKKELQKGCDR